MKLGLFSSEVLMRLHLLGVRCFEQAVGDIWRVQASWLWYNFCIDLPL